MAELKFPSRPGHVQPVETAAGEVGLIDKWIEQVWDAGIFCRPASGRTIIVILYGAYAAIGALHVMIVPITMTLFETEKSASFATRHVG